MAPPERDFPLSFRPDVLFGPMQRFFNRINSLHVIASTYGERGCPSLLSLGLSFPLGLSPLGLSLWASPPPGPLSLASLPGSPVPLLGQNFAAARKKGRRRGRAVIADAAARSSS
jgi:hypothetical protein